MVSVSNVDLVVAALRARLQRLAREKRTTGAGKASRAGLNEPRGEVADIGNLQGLSPEEFGPAVVRTILEHEFGEGMAGDPRFHRLVKSTVAILTEDPETAALFARLQEGS